MRNAQTGELGDQKASKVATVMLAKSKIHTIATMSLQIVVVKVMAIQNPVP
jgi:hypothetical protein